MSRFASTQGPLELSVDFFWIQYINALQAPSLDDKVDFHFIAFVEHDGRLYELDGRKSGPVDCGKIDGDFLSVSELATENLKANSLETWLDNST